MLDPRDWNACPSIQNTWTNLRLHFSEAHHQLHETTALQQQQSSFQANAVQEIIIKFKKNELCNNTTLTDNSSVAPLVANVDSFSTDTSMAISTLQSEILSLKEMMYHMTNPSQPTYISYHQPWIHQPPPPPYQQPFQPMYCQQVTTPTPDSLPSSTSQQTQPKQYNLLLWTHGACY